MSAFLMTTVIRKAGQNKMKSLTSHLPESVLIQVLETAFQWFVVVDKESRIIYINEGYCKFLEVSRAGSDWQTCK